MHQCIQGIVHHLFSSMVCRSAIELIRPSAHYHYQDENLNSFALHQVSPSAHHHENLNSFALHQVSPSAHHHENLNSFGPNSFALHQDREPCRGRRISFQSDDDPSPDASVQLFHIDENGLARALRFMELLDWDQATRPMPFPLINSADAMRP